MGLDSKYSTPARIYSSLVNHYINPMTGGSKDGRGLLDRRHGVLPEGSRPGRSDVSGGDAL